MASSHQTEVARKLRRDQTEAERLLWSKLRRKYVDGVKFRRQEPIGPYVVDFVSFEKKLVIELDGGQHSEESVKQLDEQRSRWLASEGFRVLRFWNNEIFGDVDAALQVIQQTLK